MGGRGSRGVREHVTCQLYSTDGAFPGFNEGKADITMYLYLSLLYVVGVPHRNHGFSQCKYIFIPAIRGRGATQKPWFHSMYICIFAPAIYVRATLKPWFQSLCRY